MLTFHTKLDCKLSYPIQNPWNLQDILFFDIETTGLSAKQSFLYLIGCICYQDNSFMVTQWLADDMDSEVLILQELKKTLQNFKRVIHYNGNNFDIPFLVQKYQRYNLSNPFESIESLDIYKSIIPFKKMLPMVNFKLKTMETFIGIKREDTYSGEELINIYAGYLGRLQYEKLLRGRMGNKQVGSLKENPAFIKSTEDIKFTSPSSEELLHILLLHNLEDVKSLLSISSMLSYVNLFNSKKTKETSSQELVEFSIETFIEDITIENNQNKSLLLTAVFNINFPRKICWKLPISLIKSFSDTDNNIYENIYIKAMVENNKLTFDIPYYHGELKLFYKNYKDYYYLPKEDTAVHKSIAEYVDKEFREKAKLNNCYTRQPGTFLPQNEILFEPAFKLMHNSKISFFEIHNTNLNIRANLIKYINSLIDFINSSKDIEIK